MRSPTMSETMVGLRFGSSDCTCSAFRRRAQVAQDVGELDAHDDAAEQAGLAGDIGLGLGEVQHATPRSDRSH